MSQYLFEHPAFIESFVVVCHDAGFTEKQASDLFDSYMKAELWHSSPDFKSALEKGLEKLAMPLPPRTAGMFSKLMSGLVKHKGVSAPIGLGLAGGAAAESGILPGDAQSGAGVGAGIGAGLGLLANPRNAIKALGRIGGSTMARLPGTMAGIVTHPKFLPGLGKPALGVGLMGGAAGLAQSMKNKGFEGLGGQYPNLDPNTGVPWYMKGRGTATDTNVPASTSIGNPYELPSDIMNRLQGGAGNAGSGQLGGVGPMADVTKYKSQLSNLEAQINAASQSLPLANNPVNAEQRRYMQSHLDDLKMQRNMAVQALNQAQGTISQDKSDMTNFAAQRMYQASKGLNNTQSEFSNLQNRQDMAQQGGLMGGLMSIYNRMTGAPTRLRALAPQYSGYNDEIERAKQLQLMAQ